MCTWVYRKKQSLARLKVWCPGGSSLKSYRFFGTSPLGSPVLRHRGYGPSGGQPHTDSRMFRSSTQRRKWSVIFVFFRVMLQFRVEY